MRLNTREWGEQGPIVLLVHGILSDSRTWRLVGPALAERGYRVVAVDLRGHGASGRDADYSPAAYGADIVETMAEFGRPALALGHSLGGLALRCAVDALLPERAVYVDPVWRHRSREVDGFEPSMFITFADAATPRLVSQLNPGWADEDIEVELATLACWDRQTARALTPLGGQSVYPDSPVVPSLIVLPERGSLFDAGETELMRSRGFEIRVVPGAGHTVHRDDLAGFLTALDGWI